MLQEQYRGLTNFITETRDCQNEELEKDRITRELEKIGSVLSDAKSKPYDRVKSVLKLVYIQMVGYDISSFQKECINLFQSTNFNEKRAAYFTFPIMVHYANASIEEKVFHVLKSELKSGNHQVQILALSTLGNLPMSSSLASSLIVELVFPLLRNKDTSREVRKRAILCLAAATRSETGWNLLGRKDSMEVLQQLLTEKDLGLLTCVLSLIRTLFSKAIEKGSLNPVMMSLVPYLLHCLSWLLTGNESTVNYIYYEIPCPFLLSELWRVLSLVPSNILMDQERQTKGALSNSLLRSIGFIQKDVHSNRRNASYSISLQALKATCRLPFTGNTFYRCLGVIRNQISMEILPTSRYFVLKALKELSFLPETWLCIQQNQQVLFPWKEDSRDTTQEDDMWVDLSLQLLSSVCNVSNASQVLGMILRIATSFHLSKSQELLLKRVCFGIARKWIKLKDLRMFAFLTTLCQKSDNRDIISEYIVTLQRDDSLQRDTFGQFIDLLHNNLTLDSGYLELLLATIPLYPAWFVSQETFNSTDLILQLYRQVKYVFENLQK
eukprot:jgi/Galph1/334/GphlegSOOS_G5054.1